MSARIIRVIERVLAIMLLAINRVANERRHAEIISDHLLHEVKDEVGRRWRHFSDPKPTESSVRELAKRAWQNGHPIFS